MRRDSRRRTRRKRKKKETQEKETLLMQKLVMQAQESFLSILIIEVRREPTNVAITSQKRKIKPKQQHNNKESKNQRKAMMMHQN